MKNPYEVLGVDRQASADKIKEVYRKLAKKYHPDTNRGNKAAEERFKEITEAYEILGDKEKREKFDQSFVDGKEKIRPERKPERSRTFSMKGNFEEEFSNFFGFNPRTKERTKDKKTESGSKIDTSQMFGSFFNIKKK